MRQEGAHAETSDSPKLATMPGVDTSPMALPRSSTVAPDAAGFYHCISRCVRRAWLCGDDPLTGRNFDHRRDWIERRLIQLADSFAVGLYAWAVMSNHTHVVLRIDPRAPRTWSDEEVVSRWLRLGPTLRNGSGCPAHREMRERALLADPARLEAIRERLGSLSWFMRFLNECIAREANGEDECTGRFWEGRFKCQALLDDSAVVACMAYVDLNPIRAGLCDTLIDSDFTTMQRRLRALAGAQLETGRLLEPMAGAMAEPGPDMTEQGYLAFVEGMVRVAMSGRGKARTPMKSALPPGIRGSPGWWFESVHRMEACFASAVGTPETLKVFAHGTGRAWIRGCSVGR